ncbi:MAG: signal peptidase I [Desulfobulbaceae bacterium]|nr:signal peptidase I [Desulfobulbaceae bacterium]
MANKPRKPWVAGLLTFLTIGLGHLYTGEARRGLILFFAQSILLAIFLPLVLLWPSLVIYGLLFIVGFAYFIYCLLDAVKIARENKFGYQLKKYNKWYVYLACWVVASLIIQPITEVSIKKNIIQAYKIPSGAMIPTLLPGDHILVDKFIYKNHEPQRGDIIIFPYPVNPSQAFVKRLVGLEGDKIEIKDKQLYINDEKYTESYIVNSDPNVMPAEVAPRDNFGPIVVPSGKYFVMGDNRDNSHDSRFWKFVEKSTVEGKVKSLYWSWDKEAFNVRWGRIGKSIDDVTN